MTFLKSRHAQLAILVLLCLLTYARSLSLPLLEDDYPNITGARTWGTPAGFSTLIHTPLIILRATGYWVTAAVWSVFGFHPLAFRAVSLLLHIANVLLTFWFCRTVPDLRGAAFFAAAFFAIHEGHQEAVMWISAINEPLMLVFGLASLIYWNAAQEPQRTALLRAVSLVFFALALLSKESAVIFLPLLLLVTPPRDWRRVLLPLIPFAALTLGAVAVVAVTRAYSFRFTDGSFSLHAPFWFTWPRSFGRLLWVWGWVALGWVLFRNKFNESRAVLMTLAWMGLGLVPYSFLTYSTAISSRQTYLASFGLALLVGWALADLASSSRRKWFVFVAAALLLHNIGYLWTRKQEQFAERAAPTEQLLDLIRKTDGPVRVQCFPQPPIVAEEAVRVALGRVPEVALIGTDDKREPAAVFCYQRR